MPTSLPTVEEMLNFASERTGKNISELKKEIEKYSQNFATVVRNPRLMTYLYLKNVLGLQPKMNIEAEGKILTVEEIFKTQATSKIGAEGYIIRAWEYKAGSSQNPAIGFLLKDKTGTIRGDIFAEEIVETWKKQKLKPLDYVQIRNASIKEFKGERRLRLSSRSEIERVKPSYGLEDIICKIANVTKGATQIIQVSFLTLEEQPYTGCPYCYRKLDGVEEGQKAVCERCGEVVAKTLKWIRGLASDGEEDIDICIPPRLAEKIEMKINPSGVYLFSGVFRPDANEFYVEELLNAVYGTVENTAITARFGKPSKEEVKRKIPLFVQSWGTIKESDLVEHVKNYLNADEETIQQAIQELTSENVIIREKDTLKVPE